MTDPRYLVRLDTLPPVSGAPTAYLCTECGAAWTGEPTCSSYNPDTGSVVECLDLSCPPGDPPERLDALGWALAVLGRRLGVRIDSADAIERMSWAEPDYWSHDFWGALTADGDCCILASTEDGWEDYDHTDANQLRRIVAAALRNHVQKVSP